MKLNIDPDWLIMMAEKEDNCNISVGGLPMTLAVETVNETGILKTPDPKYQGKNLLLLYVDDSIKATALLISYDQYPDYFLLGLSANGIIVNVNDGNYDPNIVAFVELLSDALYNFQKDPPDYRNYMEEFPILSCCLLPSNSTVHLFDVPDYENGQTYVESRTFHYLSQCGFV